ncbi:MAG: heme ABC transporter ATP-binding protein [Pseudomonadota bacterium]
MIAARSVDLSLGGQDILRGVTMALPPGKVVALCGPNGAGKSTLLACLAGEHPTCADQVFYNDRPITGLQPQTLARQRVVLEQTPSLSAEFLVQEMIELSAPLELPPSDLSRLTKDALNTLGIADLANRFVSTLSGGQQHRAHLARVLVQLHANRLLGHESALFLDEPTASLDIRHQITVLTHMAELARDGVGVLVVLHDLNLAAAFADCVVLMQDGQILHNGPPREVLTAAHLSQVYNTPIQVSQVPSGQMMIHPDLSTQTAPARCA